MIIEEEKRNSEFEPLEHFDSRDGSDSRTSEYNQNETEFNLENWKKENEVEIDSKLIGVVPMPITEFIELSEMIPDNVFRLVQKSGYEKPTPIQSWVRNHYFIMLDFGRKIPNFYRDFEPGYSQ